MAPAWFELFQVKTNARAFKSSAGSYQKKSGWLRDASSRFSPGVVRWAGQC
jgi:hypothetical protein